MNHDDMPDNILVFGSNTEGRHGKGVALFARQFFGAIYGQPSGRQGNSYAIITKNLTLGERSIPLSEIQKSILEFIEYAKAHPDLNFYVTPLGCGLAGYTRLEILPLFPKDLPPNITLDNYLLTGEPPHDPRRATRPPHQAS